MSKGFYRYVIGANVCYEIHILYWEKDTDILDAKASLYIVGEWYKKDDKNINFFERECLLSNEIVSECIKKACEDYRENI